MEWSTCTIDNPLSPQGGVESDCIDCSHQIAESHLDLFSIEGLSTNILNVAQRYGFNEFIISALISKLTNVGQDLDADGFAPCSSADGLCFGVMRVPIGQFSDAQMTDGPYSETAIIAGIELLLDAAECSCQSTSLSMRKTIEDIIMISK